MTANQIAYQRMLEETRHNKASENLTARQYAETERSNRVNENLKDRTVTADETRKRVQNTKDTVDTLVTGVTKISDSANKWVTSAWNSLAGGWTNIFSGNLR